MSSIVLSPPIQPAPPPPRAVITPAPPLVELVMLDGFELLVDGYAVPLTPNSQRLLAFLALNDRPLSRSFVAGCLWLEASDGRAGANLRSALWRLRQASAGVVQVTGDRLAVAESVRVDVREAVAHARRVVGDPEVPSAGDLDGAELLGELLPDWYDDWVLVERERLRQLRVHALEHICRRLTALGRVAADG
jgi:DNA-binding SARP family transcriptional activator